MAVTKESTSGIYGQKYISMLAGNAPYIPSNYAFIAKVNATGGETTLSFTSIPQTYTHLQIRSILGDTYSASGGSGNTSLRFNSDSGSNYSMHRIYGDGNLIQSTGNANIGANGNLIGASWGDQNTFNASVVDIYNYSNTSYYKMAKGFCGSAPNPTSTNWQINFGSGNWRNTAAITTITIDAAISGFRAGSTMALYGISV